ncbi:Ig-like domain repeat protein [Streptomyces caniscabiei]|uniref:Ig-like domain repeat protein n=1 Tax=Streptomyces caniscabiei TaxID=2746961 RepID=UPI0029A882BF|nr:Ig-like domain repeat protein [Streptomyces caniscabiei]MDX2776238.1 Ig-like domain repeat protein [Streptomyces caniscabiei]
MDGEVELLQVRSMRIKSALFVLALITHLFGAAIPVSADADVTNPVIVTILPGTGTTFGQGSVTFTVRAYDEHPGQLTLTFGDEDAVVPTAPPPDANSEDQQTNMNATLTIDTNNFPDGSYVLHVKATDEAGNSTERMARYGIDKEAPTIPTGGSPHEMVQRAGDVSFAWNSASDQTSPEGIQYDFRASQSREELEVGNGTLHQTDIPNPALIVGGVGAGTWYWQVRAVDVAGNASGWSSIWRVTLDDTAPTIDVGLPAEGMLVGSGRSLNVEATVNDDSGLKEYGVLLDGTEVYKGVQPGNGGMQPVVVDLNGIGDGEHTVTVFAVDEAGIRSAVLRTVTLDTTAPVVTTPINDDQSMQGTTRILMGSTDIHPGVHGIAVIAANGAIVASGKPTLSADGALYYDWDTTQVADGIYSLQFSSTDATGNMTTLTRTIRVKNQAVTGMGTVLPSVPLVETLDVELAQPRLLGTVTPPVDVDDVLRHETPVAEAQVESAAAHPESIPVQPTENGWQLFGILWYWWVLIAGGVGAAGWWGWRVVQQRVG